MDDNYFDSEKAFYEAIKKDKEEKPKSKPIVTNLPNIDTKTEKIVYNFTPSLTCANSPTYLTGTIDSMIGKLQPYNEEERREQGWGVPFSLFSVDGGGGGFSGGGGNSGGAGASGEW